MDVEYFKFVPIESEWVSISFSNNDYPTIYSVVIVAEKLIGKQAGFSLKIKKVKSLYGPRFMAAIWDGGTGCNSDTFLNYDECLMKGMELIQEKSDKFKAEYGEYLK